MRRQGVLPPSSANSDIHKRLFRVSQIWHYVNSIRIALFERIERRQGFGSLELHVLNQFP